MFCPIVNEEEKKGFQRCHQEQHRTRAGSESSRSISDLVPAWACRRRFQLDLKHRDAVVLVRLKGALINNYLHKTVS